MTKTSGTRLGLLPLAIATEMTSSLAIATGQASKGEENVYHPIVERDYEALWEDKESLYFHEDEGPTQYAPQQFIPSRSYSSCYTSIQPIPRSSRAISIDTNIHESIDTTVSRTTDDWPAQCYPIFALETTTPSQQVEESNEEREEEPAANQQENLTRDGSSSHRTMLPTSIDATSPASIDIKPRRGPHEEESIDTPKTYRSIPFKPTKRRMEISNLEIPNLETWWMITTI
ncbi:hypothetical protein Bca101_010326 [Brassica carinata]